MDERGRESGEGRQRRDGSGVGGDLEMSLG